MYRTFITKSRAGHYLATVRTVTAKGIGHVVFKSDKRSTKDAAKSEAADFIAEQA